MTNSIPEVEGKAYRLGLYACGLGAVFLAISLFTPRWRVDEVGTRFLSTWWTEISVMDSKQYGLIYVKGGYIQSWNSVVQTTCWFRDLFQGLNFIGHGANLIEAASGEGFADFFSDEDECENGLCFEGYMIHMNERCEQYEKIRLVSFATMGFTVFAVFSSFLAMAMAAMSKYYRTGGIIFGLMLFSSVACLILNLVWAAVTNAAFNTLGETAWYPFPALGIAWFLHLYGGLLMLSGIIVYGVKVLPLVQMFDPAQKKIDKTEKKLERLERREAEREAAQELEMVQQMQMQANTQYAPAAGYGAGAPGFYQGAPGGVAPMQIGLSMGQASPNGAQYPAGGAVYAGGAPPGFSQPYGQA